MLFCFSDSLLATSVLISDKKGLGNLCDTCFSNERTIMAKIWMTWILNVNSQKFSVTQRLFKKSRLTIIAYQESLTDEDIVRQRLKVMSAVND